MNMGKSFEKTFRNGFPLNGRLGNETFYEIIADGEKYQFVNFASAFLSNANSYGGSSVKQIFTNADEYYIFERISGTLVKTKKSLAAITESLPYLKERITKVSTEKKLKLRNEDEIRLLFEALNQ
jgi:hypothetical protein